ncbi:MAG: hypothetical protein ACKO6F_07300 [Cyanobium sp.]
MLIKSHSLVLPIWSNEAGDAGDGLTARHDPALLQQNLLAWKRWWRVNFSRAV